jgi:Pvc16 N-terminal domain
MSAPEAIAAVTDTLHQLLQTAADGGAIVTVKAPDRIRPGTGLQINLFLYQAQPSAAWRNVDLPNQLRPGETGYPPLALNLYYMLTVFGGDNDESKCHRLLGRAMSILHDHPVLGREEIRLISPDSRLDAQVERVRLTLQPLSLDDIFKIWSTCQTPYRPSVAYEVSVVLIDSKVPKVTPLPVLTRVIDVQPGLVPPYPTIDSVTSTPVVPALGSVLTFAGHHLDPSAIPPVARFDSSALPDPIDVALDAGGTTSQATLTLPAGQPNNWPPGFYTVSLIFDPGDRKERSTNALPFTLAPQITFVTNPVTIIPPVNPGDDNSIVVDINVAPPLHAEQRVALLFGDREIPAANRTGSPVATLSFTIPKILPKAQDFLVRLRVDGADSPLIAPTDPPTFLASSRLGVKP